VLAWVAAVTMMVAFVVRFNDSVTSAFTSFGTTLVQFQKYEQRFNGGGPPPQEQRKRRRLVLGDDQALKRMATLAAAVSPERYFGRAQVRAGREEANAPVLVGVTPDYALANNQ